MPFKRPDQDLQSAVLVEHDLSDALAVKHGEDEPDEDGLAGPGRPADERMAGVLATAAVGIFRVAGMQREVVRRARARHQQRQCIAPVVAASRAHTDSCGSSPWRRNCAR